MCKDGHGCDKPSPQNAGRINASLAAVTSDHVFVGWDYPPRLRQRAGVPKGRLRLLVVKELVRLDHGADVKKKTLPGGYAIVDEGPGGRLR